MASLENQPVNTTYQSIVKLSDNGTVPTTVGEQLSDGLGNLIPMKVSSNSVQFTASCQVQTPTLADHATRKDYVDAINSNLTASINAVANDLNDAEADIVTLQGDVFDLETGVGNVISVNGIAGAVTLSGGTNVTLNVVGNDIEINSSGGGAVTSVNGEIGDVLVTYIPETVKNVTAGTLFRGTPVHVTGSVGQQAEVILADAATNYPAHYILNEDINAGASGEAIALGLIENVDLTPFGLLASNFSEGDEVYLGAAGGFTNVRPTGTNAVQHLGVVLKVNVGGNQISGMINGLGSVNIGAQGLPNLANGFVWRGNSSGVPQAVNQNTLSVSSAITANSATTSVSSQTADYATDAANVKVDTVSSGSYRVILADTSFSAGAYTDLYADFGGGITYNPAGDILTVGGLSVANSVAAGGTLSGGTLDISGGADIDGTLSLGGIGNVENEINQNASDIATLQANVYSNVITHTTSPLNIGDGNLSTYAGKTILIDSSTSVDVELDMSTTPAVGVEFYVVRFGTGTVTAANYQGTIYSTAGIAPSARARYSSFVVKHVGSNNWLVLGDIA